jgi:hypothetical protein
MTWPALLGSAQAMLSAWLALAAVTSVVRTAGAQNREQPPHVLKLEELEKVATPRAAESDAVPARGLPAIITICRERRSGRCWSTTSEECVAADVFRKVIEGQDAGRALADCRAVLETPVSDVPLPHAP